MTTEQKRRVSFISDISPDCQKIFQDGSYLLLNIIFKDFRITSYWKFCLVTSFVG